MVVTSKAVGVPASLTNRYVSMITTFCLTHRLQVVFFFSWPSNSSSSQVWFVSCHAPPPKCPLRLLCPPPPGPRWGRQYGGTQGYFGSGQDTAWCSVLWEIRTCWGHTLSSNQAICGLSSTEGTVVRVKTGAVPSAMGPGYGSGMAPCLGFVAAEWGAK